MAMSDEDVRILTAAELYGHRRHNTRNAAMAEDALIEALMVELAREIPDGPRLRMAKQNSNWIEPPLAPDHLTNLPSEIDFPYVDDEGITTFDDRYVFRLNQHEPKEKKKLKRPPEKRLLGNQGIGESLFAELIASLEDGFHARPSIKLPVPDHIKAILVDDWENVTKNNQLVPLPHPHPVDEIINDYLTSERPNRDPESPHLDILEETMAGMKEYFEKALGRILLYRFERPQYHEIRKVWEKAGEADANKTVCDTYGAEHLCRLIVSLPELIAQTTMDQQSVSRLREELSKFTVWLGKNAKNYFVSEYETPAQEYIDRARNS